jgi:hypothetical protein
MTAPLRVTGAKYFEFLRAPSGSSDAGVHRQWARERAALLWARPDLAGHLRRQELYERLPADRDRRRADVELPDAGFDAVSVQWFDGVEAYDASRAAPGAQELRELDRRFRHPGSASVLTGSPDLIVGPSGGDPASGMSLICILARAPGMDLSKFHDHWLHQHGGFFQTVPELRDPLLGYEQNHGLDIDDSDYDGVTQQWFESLDAWTTSIEAPANSEIIGPDMALFLNPKRVHFVLAGPPTVLFAR